MELNKELLAEVLGVMIITSCKIHNNRVYYTSYEVPTVKWKSLNIYETAHKYKVWASEQLLSHVACSLASRLHTGGAKAFFTQLDIRVYGYHPSEVFCADTEPKAIFLACEWIYIMLKRGDISSPEEKEQVCEWMQERGYHEYE